MKQLPVPPGQRARLKLATREAITELGGVDAAEATSRSNKARLSHFQNLAMPDTPPLDVAADFEAVLGRPIFTAVMASIAGYALIPMLLEGEGCDVRAIAEVFAACGDAGKEWGVAMQDGQLSEVERAALANKLDRLAIAAHQAKALVLAGGGK